MSEESENDDMKDLLSEVEYLKVENYLLKQNAEFQKKFEEHKEKVDERIDKGGFKLGIAGLVVLGIAWFGTYREIGDRVQKRLDEEFGSKKIQIQISKAADKATRELMQKRSIEFSNDEHNQLKCLAEKQGKELFRLQCRASDGQPDEARGVCVNRNGGETDYVATFDKISCGSR